MDGRICILLSYNGTPRTAGSASDTDWAVALRQLSDHNQLLADPRI